MEVRALPEGRAGNDMVLSYWQLGAMEGSWPAEAGQSLYGHSGFIGELARALYPLTPAARRQRDGSDKWTHPKGAGKDS